MLFSACLDPIGRVDGLGELLLRALRTGIDTNHVLMLSALHEAVERQVSGHSQAKVEDGNILVSFSHHVRV